MTPRTLIPRLMDWADREPDGLSLMAAGGQFQVQRLTEIAEWACQTGDGDLVEFGTFAGAFTVQLAQLARRYKRRVLCFDTFPPGTAYQLEEKVMPEFLAAIAPWPEVRFYRLDVNGDECRRLVQAQPIRFALIDTMKHHEEVRKQLRALLPVCTGPIAVDDSWCPDVPRACDDEARDYPEWRHVHLSGLRETWMVRR